MLRENTSSLTKTEEKIIAFLQKNPPKTWTDYQAVREKWHIAFNTLNRLMSWLNIDIPKKPGKEENEMEKEKLINYQELSQSLLEAVSQNKPKIHLPKPKTLPAGKLTEQAVLHLSDIHYGKINYFYDTEKNQRQLTYNPAIFVKEMNRLLDSMATINHLLAGGYNLEVLHIFATGDLVDNEIIYRGQSKFVEEGVISQVLNLSFYLKEMIVNLLKLFPRIEMVVVGGNHSRITARREADWDENNFDYLVGCLLQRMFEGEERVKIIVPQSWFYVAKVYGWKYLLHHGNTVWSWMGMPYYGITRQSKSRMIEVPFDVELIGHFHPPQIFPLPTSSHSITFVNGCWIEKDTWSWQKYATISRAKQHYFGVSPKRAISWSFPLELTVIDANQKKVM